ncbi:hypothetical protein [Microvirga sp. 2TAF3]|uniref:hypothetical protein n=1 Tax=Microvirga sp. 2TAF3 TaxID=3233014 RepID=UPI003F9EA1E4
MTWTAALGWFFAGYALLTGIFILLKNRLENRRPQATLAWMLLFIGLSGIGRNCRKPAGNLVQHMPLASSGGSSCSKVASFAAR